MDTRRMFMKKALLLSGAAGMSQVIPAAVQRALAINPDPGTTYLDAEHVVILMQENRSFDHCFGTLRGVRGFNDPRAITLPDKNLVWLQTNAAGETYTPFRLGIRESRATWMGALPHARASQVDAYNEGRFNKWLDSKQSRHKEYAKMPLTMGYYTREDIPFNYALADAFTICDQHFCSAMTSTHPNRLYLWSGTIREQQQAGSKAHIRNEDLSFGRAGWTTFPERLQQNGVSWKVYQNEITCGGGFEGEERSWLGNFGCNPLEFFAAFNVKHSTKYAESLQNRQKGLLADLKTMKDRLSNRPPTNKNQYEKLKNNIARKEQVLKETMDELKKWTKDSFNELSAREKELFRRAFTTNEGDPFYRELTSFEYGEAGTNRQVNVPKGDILHQFRTDVENGQLPMVSWIVGPQNFSDHPSAPWYGAWYVSEVMDILTKNPSVWKKTIFLLTYDENDGYFDHIPPFVAPDPRIAGAGKCSAGIDAAVERTWADQEIREGISPKQARDGAIGLGFRVPLIIASPWSRGGKVCSQVFDHTSPLQFLETFISKKTGRPIREENISEWRRTVCGDLSAAFSAYNGQPPEPLPFLEKIPFVEGIHKAKWKSLPSGYKKLTPAEIRSLNSSPADSPYMPEQEPGIRPACALPYELYVDAALTPDKEKVEMVLKAGNQVFGNRSAGAAFTVYAIDNDARQSLNSSITDNSSRNAGWCRSYAVRAGDQLSDGWPLTASGGKNYHLRAYGPNGFFREFVGNAEDPFLDITIEYERSAADSRQLTGNLTISLRNLNSNKPCKIKITDAAYGAGVQSRELNPSTAKPGAPGASGPTGKTGQEQIILDLSKSFGWYDFVLSVEGAGGFKRRYAGKVESGRQTYSDPVMGNVFK